MESRPKISVVTSVRNGARYLRQAVQSILEQSYPDFEYLLFDNGSTDKTYSILQDFAKHDSRVKIFKREEGSYIARLNEGISLAQGEWIARMDADDVSRPHRFLRQVEYLTDNPSCAAVGTRVVLIDGHGLPYSNRNNLLTHAEIDTGHMAKGCEGSKLCHPSVMMRKDAFLSVGGYREEFELAEDVDLFLRIAEAGLQLANLPEILFEYRIHPNCEGSVRRAAQLNKIAQAALEAHQRRGLNPPEDYLDHLPIARPLGLPEGIMRIANDNGYWRTARSYSLRGLMHRPWSPSAWKNAARFTFGWGEDRESTS